MPGMSRESTVETEGTHSPPPDSLRSESPSRASSVRMSTTSSRYSGTTAPSDSGSSRIRSPPPSIMDAPRLAPAGSDRMSPLTGRPPSPTKGMGGFVESAMLKRADSVNKRWSAQAPQGHKRQNSTASNRSSHAGGYGGPASPTRLDRASISLTGGNSLEPAHGSRPSSSHSNLTVTQSADGQTADMDRDGFVKPSKPLHIRARSVASLQQSTAEPSPPSSPSRRWSPAKSSWLESALTKAEDKPKAQPAALAQPSWMAEINKAKHNKANSSIQDPPKLPSSESSLPELAPLARTAQPVPSPAKAVSPPLEQAMAKPVEKSMSPILETATSPPLGKAKSPPPEPAAKPLNLTKLESLPTAKSPSLAASPPTTKSSWEAKKPVPTPGKIDFRSNLKSRQLPTDGNSKNEPEFKNALGKLKRTQTEKFVAPDMLKDNILRGKAGLTITGGPAKRERVDELKESLIKQKEAMKVKAASEPKKPIEKPADVTSTPEALAKRNVLHRSQSSKDSVVAAKSSNADMPEAIARMKTMKEKAKPMSPNKTNSPPVTDLPTFPGASPSPPPPQRKPSAETISSRLSSASLSKNSEEAIEEAKPQPLALPGMSKSIGGSSKLAGRFSPALAGILARGPPTTGKNVGASETAGSTDRSSPPSSSEPLEHKTKGRARGPKRRAPTKQPEELPRTNRSPASSPVHLDPASSFAASSISAPIEVASSPMSPINKDKISIPTKSPSTSATSLLLNSTASPAPLFTGAKTSTPLKSPSASISSDTESIANVSLVKSKDVLHSSPQQLKFQAQDQVNEAGGLTPKAVSTPAKPKPLAPTKSPFLSEKPSTQANERENLAPASTSLASKPQLQASRAPLLEQEAQGRSSARSIEASRPTAISRRLSDAPSDQNLMAVHEDTTESSKPSLTPKSSYLKSSISTSPADVSASETSTPNVSVKDATAIWGRQAAQPQSSPGRPKSPVKLPTRHDEERAMRAAGLMPPPQVPDQTKKPVGLGLGISAPTSGQTPSHSKTDDRSATKFPLSPPMSPGSTTKPTSRTLNLAGKTPEQSFQVPKLEGARSRPVSASLKAPPESPIPNTSEAHRLFASFFDDQPIVAPEMDDVDTGAILECYPLANEKVNTLSKQLHLITGDGKLLPVPSHQEYILFSDSMYVCKHMFTSSSGASSTEVYLWVGAAVPRPAVEDAQLFGRKVARDNGGKLILLEQGKETPIFFQALGGILVTFRARSSSGMPSTFMLCGRRHVGHIAFDEVDFSLSSFCSGFSYLISSNSRLHLWKGKGCSAEELGCARLIAMDLGTTSDVAEISEDTESDSFFNLFPHQDGHQDKTIPRSADHWRLKGSNDKYRCRLFHVEQHNSRSSTLQVSSFFSNLTRRTSWSSLTSPRASPTPDEQPKKPTTPKPMPSPQSQPSTTRIVELAPFTQSDVDAEGIYVLDAFFEVYMYVSLLYDKYAA
jgi:hypothetical protein